MRLEPYLCMGGTEVANAARTFAYVNNLGLPRAIVNTSCGCDVYDEGYTYPADDPAPWYEPTRPESEDFLGFYAYDISLEPVMGRATNPRVTGGSVIGANRFNHRLIPVNGILIARSALGMAYGERWLNEVLRGGVCSEGCAADDIEILPACPEPGYDEETYFRYLHSSALIDGPLFRQADGVSAECYVQEAVFTLASEWPWLYHPESICVENEMVDPGLSPHCLFTTPTWMGDGTFYIEVAIADDVDEPGEITITGRVSLEDDCPVGPPTDAAVPCFEYVIPEFTIDPGDKIIIDGTRRQVLYYDATSKRAKGGMSKLQFEGPFRWPDVPPCTSVCVSVDMSTEPGAPSNGLVTIHSFLREI